MITISIVAEKGGVGKTTTAQAIIELLRRKKARVLAIDLDQQGNLSYALDVEGAKYSAHELLSNKAPVNKIIYKDAIKGNESLALLNDKLNNAALKNKLKPISGKYDYCIIDVAPKLDKTMVMALLASNYVVLPTFADTFSSKGLNKTIRVISEIQRANSSLEIAGVLFTMYNPRNVLSRQMKEVIETKLKKLKIHSFKATINKNIAISEAQAMQQPLEKYNKNSKAISDYKKFVKELLLIVK